jgi:hypothetical protein
MGPKQIEHPYLVNTDLVNMEKWIRAQTAGSIIGSWNEGFAGHPHMMYSSATHVGSMG